MPVYCYRRKDNDELVELFMSRDQMNARQNEQCEIQLEDGTIAERDFQAEFAHIGTHPGNYPMESVAVGVSPKQVKEAEEHSRKIGVPTHFTKRGDAIFESAAHRKRYCEATGFFDRNAGYSDPCRH